MNNATNYKEIAKWKRLYYNCLYTLISLQIISLRLTLFLNIVRGKNMNFKCKCGKVIITYDVFYEESGKFKAYVYTYPVCGCCQIDIHYKNKVKIIKRFLKK